jgi:hypothetical protein
MAIDYKAPGISIKEYTDANIAPLLATPDSICIVGPTPGPITDSRTVVLTDATSATGTAASGSKVITNVTQTSGAFTIGQSISGTGIANNTTITDVSGISPAITLSLSVATTATVSGTLTARGAEIIPASAGVVQSITKVVAADTNQINSAVNPYDSAIGYTTNSYDSGVTTGTNTANRAFGTNVIARKPTPVTNYPAIDNEDVVTVTYTYLPANFWDAKRFDNMSDIEARYGTAYDATQKSIYSPVSLAAQIAFENGATNIIVQPVFYQETDGTKRQPTNLELINLTNTWNKTLESLRAIEDLGIIVPISGQESTYQVNPAASAVELTDSVQLSIIKAVQNHIYYQYVNNHEILVGIFGEDGTDNSTNTVYASQPTLQSHAASLRAAYNGDYAQNSVLISPAKFRRISPLGNVINLGGQYVAAAVAGMLASRAVSASLTRKNIIGFNEIYELRTKQEKNDDSKNGLFVIEQKGYLTQIRHALTTDTTSVARSELSVVRAKQNLINSIAKTINEQVIGTVVADNNAPLIIASVIGGTLSQMQGNGDIVGFSDVQAKTLTINPTTIEVRFNYRPAFPVNYIQIGFSVDITSGELNIGTTTNQVNTGA